MTERLIELFEEILDTIDPDSNEDLLEEIEDILIDLRNKGY